MSLYTSGSKNGIKVVSNKGNPFIANAIQEQGDAGACPLLFPPGYFLVTADGSADTGWGFGAAAITEFRQERLPTVQTGPWNYVLQHTGFFVGAGVSELIGFYMAMELALRATEAGKVISIDSDHVTRWVMEEKDPSLEGIKNMGLIRVVRRRYQELLRHAEESKTDLYILLIPSKANAAHRPAITIQRWARRRHWLEESTLPRHFPNLTKVLWETQQTHARAHTDHLPRSRIKFTPSAICRLWRDVTEEACDGLTGRKGLRLRPMAFGSREESDTDRCSANPSLLYVEMAGPPGHHGWVPLRSVFQ